MTDVATALVSDEEIVQRAASIADIDGYPPLDEFYAELEKLRERYPQQLTSTRVGTSRLGEPIPLYSLAYDGDEAEPLRCLIVGGVHPNEPIGSHTIVKLLTDLLGDDSFRNRMGAEWHIIPCADPDGMRLNEGWFDNPFDSEIYFRSFYRPPGDEQVEWTFPINYKRRYFDKMLPETQALQRVIDEVRPHLYVPLHNSESGGAYYYLSAAVSSVIPLLHRLPAELDIPLHLGEPEAAHLDTLAPAVFAAGSPEDVYEWREANGLDPAPDGGAGQSSTSYARKHHGTHSLIAELPIWQTAGADDTSGAGVSYAALLREAGEALVHSGTELTALLEKVQPSLVIDSPILRSAQAFLPGLARSGELMILRSEQEENQREATVAERPMSVVWMYRLRFGGALLRALRAEVSAGTANVLVRHVAEELDRIWMDWMRQRDEDEKPVGIPVRRVVGVQYGAVVGFVAHGQRVKKEES